MKWQNIASIIGAISGIVSLCVVLYAAGYKLGTIDTKVATLWDFYTDLAMKDHITDRPKHVGNPVPNNPHPRITLPQTFLEVTQRITSDNQNKDISSVVSLIMQELAVNHREQMNKFIKERGIRRTDFINIIADEVRRIRGS